MNETFERNGYIDRSNGNFCWKKKDRDRGKRDERISYGDAVSCITFMDLNIIYIS